MIDVFTTAERLLTAADYVLLRLADTETPSLAFEGRTVVGFMHVYDIPSDLVRFWQRDHEDAIRRLSFAFRRAGDKAWNTYAVFLAAADPDVRATHAMHVIEEDLSATRKIARAGLHTSADVRSALLPLLPVVNAPLLERIDIASEMRERAQDVPPAALDAFLQNRPEEEVLELLEDPE